MTGPRPEFTRAVQDIAPWETTALPPDQERQFREWASSRKITDVDHPESRYDYRGFWLNGGRSSSADGHFPDTFKQHGHPTFSEESRYSLGRGDGGTWNGEQFRAPTPQDTTNTLRAIRRKLSSDPRSR